MLARLIVTAAAEMKVEENDDNRTRRGTNNKTSSCVTAVTVRAIGVIVLHGRWLFQPGRMVRLARRFGIAGGDYYRRAVAQATMTTRSSDKREVQDGR